MRKKFIILMVVFVFNFNVMASDAQVLRIHGSNTIGATLAPELVKRWLLQKGYEISYDKVTAKEERNILAIKQHDKIKVEIHAHGSSTSFKDFNSGKTDIGLSSRPVKDKELQMLSGLGDLSGKHSEYVVALDGLPIIVNKKNPLEKISRDTLSKIFSGKITNWSELGLKPGNINVYARDDNSGTYDTFKHLVLDKGVALVKTAKRFESNTVLSDSVANDPAGIGFVGMAYIRNAKVLSVNDKGTRALKPDSFSVATEDYVLSRRLFMYIPEIDPNPLAKEFVLFAVSSAADNTVTKVGFVSQEISGYRLTMPQTAPDEYRQFTTGAVRLSLNIRFKSGSIKLDNKAVRDVERLVEYFKQPENQYRKLLLFGFADANEVSPYISNSFSVTRADSVADYLAKNAIYPVRVRGFGQELPVASNETTTGRYANRRVEVWMM